MKKLKKMMALVITMIMVVGTINLSVFAEGEVTRSITIDGLEKGDKVTFYKVLSWADTTAEAETNKAVSGWYFEAPFKTDSHIQVGNDLGSAYLKAAINDKNQLVLTDDMANDLAYALNTTATPVNATPLEVAENATSVTYTFTPDQNTDYTDYDGLYMAVITPADQDVVYNPVFVHVAPGENNGSYTVVESALDYMDASTDAATGAVIGGAAKKSRVSLTKESSNDSDYTDSVTETKPDPEDDGDTTAPYDELDFTVKTTIPGYGDTFDYPVFKLTDKLNSMRLMYPGAAQGSHTNAAGETVTDTYDAAITVKVGNDTFTIDGTDDFENTTFKITPADGQYVIEFKEAFLKTVHVPTAVEVTYKAKVQPGANTNVIKEKNTVKLEFSHDPTTEDDEHHGGDINYKKDITNHYTFSIDANNLVGPHGERIGESGSELIKIGVDKDGNPIKSETKTYSNVTTTEYEASPLAGAEFVLYGSNTDGTVNKSKIIGKATSDASGRINFTGLDAGKYWLEETKAPAGYVKQSGEFPITISATMVEREETEYTTDGENWISKTAYEALDASAKEAYQSYTYKFDELQSYSVTYGNDVTSYTFNHEHEGNNGEIKWSIATSSEAPSSIKNTKGVELPSTGGIGTTLFYIIGSILVLGAGVLLVTRRRMSEN